MPQDPGGSWGAAWLVAGALALCVLTALEVFWRRRGHEPGISAGPGLWCYHRERLERAGPNTIALLGSSRMQTGLVPEVFLEEHPNADLVQLAAPGMGPFAALNDVAENSRFSGLVVCSISARTMQPSQLDEQKSLVDYYHHQWGPGTKASLLLSTVLEERLVVLRPRLGGEQLMAALLAGHLPAVDPIRTTFDRRWMSDYDSVNLQGMVDARVAYFLAQMRESPPASPDEWRSVIDRLAGVCRKIEARGARVVFVLFPMGELFQKLEDQYLPEDRYWSPLVQAVGTEVIDYRDMPGYETLRCPDGSHLDSASAERFTRWLARELKARGFFE